MRRVLCAIALAIPVVVFTPSEVTGPTAVKRALDQIDAVRGLLTEET